MTKVKTIQNDSGNKGLRTRCAVNKIDAISPRKSIYMLVCIITLIVGFCCIESAIFANALTTTSTPFVAKPGDMYLVKSDNTSTSSSVSFSVGTYNHLAIVCDSNSTIESWGLRNDGKNGVRKWLNSETVANFKNYDVFRLINDTTGAIGRAAVEYAKSKLGKPYNWDFGSKSKTDSFYCSSLAWRAYQMNGYDIDSKPMDPIRLFGFWGPIIGWIDTCAPDEIANSKLLVKVFSK